MAVSRCFVSRKRELIQKWTTWLLIAPVVGIPVWIGRGPTAALAALLAIVAVLEYVRLVKLSRVDTCVLLALSVLYPLAAWLRPSLLGLAPIIVLACALPAVLSGDVEHGGRRMAFTGFGSVWICWSLAHLVMLWPDTFLVAFAASAADVAAWCGGKGLRRFRWARKPLSPLSPNKTVGGVVGAVIGSFLVLTLLGTISVGLLIAVAFGGLLGDLLESMVKRQAQVKDAGDVAAGLRRPARPDRLAIASPPAGVSPRMSGQMVRAAQLISVVAVPDEFLAQERQSRVWSAIARLVTSPYGLLLAFVWGYAEALSWFIVAEMALILFAAAVPRRVMPWAAAVIVGSVLGVLTNAWLTSRGVLLPAPLTTPRMAATAFDQLAAGPSAMMNQALSGIPVKVYARAAGEHHIEMWNLAGWTLLERGLRISMVGLVVWLLSKLFHPLLRRLFGVYLIIAAVVFIAALSAVIAAWS